MHFSTITGAGLALAATLATSTPITKRQTSIDPSKQFQITASTIPAQGTNSGITYNLTPYTTGTGDAKQLALRQAASSDALANFTLDGDELILYSAAVCDQFNACTPPQKYGDVFPQNNEIVTFQEGLTSAEAQPETGGFAINGANNVVDTANDDAVQFYMCQQSESLNVLTFEASGSDCVPVVLTATQ